MCDLCTVEFSFEVYSVNMVHFGVVVVSLSKRLTNC